MKTCNHILGHYEEHDYSGSSEFNLISMEENSVPILKMILAEKDHFSFCPKCGHSLLGVIESIITKPQKKAP